MILKRLFIQNFLAHDNTEIEFAPYGITAFIGENGAGKSSILEAISYALTGKSSKGNSARDLVKWGKNEAKVILELSKDGVDYKIERKIKLKGKRTTTEGVIYKKEKDRYLPYYQKEINRNIPKLTGLTTKVFQNTVLVRQGEIEGLINLQPSKRAEIIQELLDITLYDMISKKFAEIRKELEYKIENKLHSIENLDKLAEEIEGLKKEERALKEKLDNIKEKKAKIEEQINKLKAERGKIEAQLREIIKREQEKVKLEENLKNIYQQIEEYERELEDIATKKELIKQYIPYLKQLEEAKEKLEKIRKLENLKTKLNSIEEKIERIKELEAVIKEFSQLAKEFEEKEKELEDINKKLKELNKLKGNLQAVIENEKKLKNELTGYISKCKNIALELAKVKPIYKTLEINPTIINEHLRNVDEDINKIEEEISKLKGEKFRIEKEGKELRKQKEDVENLKGACPTCLRPIDEHSKEEILKEIEEKLKELREKYTEINGKLKDLEEKLKLYKNIKTSLEEYKNIYKLYLEQEGKYKEIKYQREKLERQIKELESLEEREKEIKEFIEKNKDNYLKYIQAQKELKGINRELIEKEYNKLKDEIALLEDELKNITVENLKAEIEKLERKREEYIKLGNSISKEELIRKAVEDLKNRILKIQNRLTELKGLIDTKGELEAKLEEINKELEKYEAERNSILEKYTEINSQYSSITTLLKAKTDELKEMEKIKKEIEEFREKLERAKRLEFALGKEGIQKYLIDIALYELPKITNKLFSNFGFPFEQIIFERNFDIKLKAPTLEKEDRFVSVQAISGGQRIALALALRLALVQFLSTKAQFLILDEPTVHLDDTRRNELVNLLIQLKNQSQGRGLIKQLIVVSHDTELKDSADNVYFINRGKVETEPVP